MKIMKKITLYLAFFYFFFTPLSSLENKILFKVNNKIITTQDINDEINYLGILNKDFLSLEKKNIFEVAKNSLIKEKIKEIEVINFFNKIEINDNYLKKIIKNMYSNMGFNSLDEFNNFLSSRKITQDNFKKKITINIMWNDLIFLKYNKKIKIDEDTLMSNIKKTYKKHKKSFLLSEIVFNVDIDENISDKFNQIKNSIKKNGFENSALKYSISNSSNLGGKLGWVDENTINKNILDKLNLLKIDEFTNPITVQSGFLILKINNIKKIKINIDFNEELKKLKTEKKNQQLEQFSNIYFNKVKKNIVVNEL